MRPWKDQNADADGFVEIQWKTTKDSEMSPSSLSVNNPSVNLPLQDLDVIPDFVSPQETLQLLDEVYSSSKDEFVWEGFERRRRVRRFFLNSPPASDDNDFDTPFPPTLQILVDRLLNITNQTSINQLTVEEYPPNQLSACLSQSRTQVTTFETVTSGSENGNWFVATLPLTVSLIENVNRPKRRDVSCWDLLPPAEQHSTSVLLQKSTLLVKRGEFLFDWRCRIVQAATSSSSSSSIEPSIADDVGNTMPASATDKVVVLIKFFCLPLDLLPSTPSLSTGRQQVPSLTVQPTVTNPEFGYVPTKDSREEQIRRRCMAMPPLESLLTIVITTSPIKSNPSTELLERVLETFLLGGGPTFAYGCRKVIVCDGCRQKGESTTKRHANDKQAMRNGIVTADQLRNYVQFKENLKRRCDEAGSVRPGETRPASPFVNTTVEELDFRHGYGFALKHAVTECVSTPYVMVIQHDRTFMRPTPIAETVDAMWHDPKIKYVGMSMRSNLLYRDQFVGQYGRPYAEEMASCILRPPELTVDANLYGPNSESTRQFDYGPNDRLKDNIQALIETYQVSQQYATYLEWAQGGGQSGDQPMQQQAPPTSPGKWQLSLTPTFFWYDNVHICETKHYRDFVFNPTYKMVVRGGFVEDKLSPVIKRTVERLGLAEGHSRFGCFLLDDHSGMFFTGHLDGGSYMTESQRAELSARYDRLKECKT